MLPEQGGFNPFEWMSINHEFSFGGRIEAKEKSKQAGLARTRRSNDRNVISRTDGQADAFQNRLAVDAKMNVPHLDRNTGTLFKGRSPFCLSELGHRSLWRRCFR